MQFVQAAFFIPQVIRVKMMGTINLADRLPAIYVLGVLGARRFLLALYERTSPVNVMDNMPSGPFAGLWCGTFLPLLAVLVLLNWRLLSLQALLVRWRQIRMQLRAYNYRHESRPDESNVMDEGYRFTYKARAGANDDCPICLQKLHKDPSRESAVSEIEEGLVVTCQIARTPCMHLYHWECFREWISKKPQCALCRAELPPLV